VPLLGIGLLAAAFAYVAGIAAARALGAQLASFVGLSEVLFATIYAWLLLGQRLTATQLGGGALAVVGIALVRIGESAPAAHNETGTEPVAPAETTGQANLPTEGSGTSFPGSTEVAPWGKAGV